MRVRTLVLSVAKGHPAESSSEVLITNLLRRIDKTNSDQRRAEVLVQLADKTVAATGFATDR